MPYTLVFLKNTAGNPRSWWARKMNQTRQVRATININRSNVFVGQIVRTLGPTEEQPLGYYETGDGVFWQAVLVTEQVL